MIAPAMSAAIHTGWMVSTNATVSRTVAAASAASRNSSSRLTWRGRSATTAASARDPGRPARTSASTRARETELSAASAAANKPASGTSRTAMTISGVLMRRPSAVFEPDGAEQCVVAATLGLASGGFRDGGAPVGEELVLQGEHLAFLVGLAVVVAEQVKHAVHGEQVQLVGERVAGLAGLRLRELRTEHDVAEQRGPHVRGVG